MKPPIKSNFARIVAILDSFDATNTPLESQQLIRNAGASRSTGFGLIRAMVDAGWLTRVDHGFFKLGPKAAQMFHFPMEADQAFKETSVRVINASPDRSIKPTGASGNQEWVPELLELVPTQRFKCTGPVRIAFANASTNNPWRVAMLQSMKYAERLHADQLKSFQVADANEDPQLQLAQINQFVAEGIDLLLISQTKTDNATLSNRLRVLAEEGLPIVAVDRRPDPIDSLISFVTASDRRIGRVSAVWLAEKMNGAGRVWMLSGMKGASPAIRRQEAALTAFAQFPDIKVEEIAFTGWTEKGGYDAIDKLLADGHSAPDGVWCDSGLQGIGSLTRFGQENQAPPYHTGGDLNRMYKLALHEKVPFAAVDYPAAMGARALEVAIEILSGKPVQRRIEVPVQVVLPRGCETPSVKADIWAETHVRWELPDTAILSQGPSLRQRKPRSELTNDG